MWESDRKGETVVSLLSEPDAITVVRNVMPTPLPTNTTYLILLHTIQKRLKTIIVKAIWFLHIHKIELVRSPRFHVTNGKVEPLNRGFAFISKWILK